MFWVLRDMNKCSCALSAGHSLWLPAWSFWLWFCLKHRHRLKRRIDLKNRICLKWRIFLRLWIYKSHSEQCMKSTTSHFPNDLKRTRIITTKMSKIVSSAFLYQIIKNLQQIRISRFLFLISLCPKEKLLLALLRVIALQASSHKLFSPPIFFVFFSHFI